MTIEKMEKAKELNNRIKYIEEQLQRVELVDGKNQTEIVSNNKMFYLPIDIKDTIILLCKSHYENKLKQIKKEFEEL